MNTIPHTFIIAAMTADGFIAKTSHHLSTSWTSKEDKDFFIETTKRAGVVVMGSHTFQTMKRPLPGRLNIVYSKKSHYEGVEVTSKEPRKLLEDLSVRGYSEVAIIGGSQINTLFLEAGVVDTLYLTVEPIVFGKGIALFVDELNAPLELKKFQKIGKETLLVEYAIRGKKN